MAASKPLKRLPRLILGLGLGATLAAVAQGGWQWLQAERVNRLIATRSPELARLDAPQAAFAHGVIEADSGAALEALAAYRRAGQGDDGGIAVAAWYNAGNLYLRQARALRDAGDTEADRPRTLAELAKDGYRRALRQQPDYWPARYNLERALQAFPDAGDEDPGPAPATGRERAVTTMQGSSLGAP